MGHEAICVPLFEVVPLAWTPPDPCDFDAVAMTSANAARHGGDNLRRYVHLPLFAVGAATANAAREAGFGDVTLGRGTGDDLAPLFAGLRVVHFAGADFHPLPGARAVPVYVAQPRQLTEIDQRQLAAPIAMVHSPRAGQALAAVVSDRAETDVVAISAIAAEAVGTGWRSVTVAAAPNDTAMLASLDKVCKGRAGPTAGQD